MSVLRSLTKFLCVSSSHLKIMLKDYDRNQKKENYKRSICIWTKRQVTITIWKRFSFPLSIFYNPGLLKRKESGSSDRAQASLGHCLCQSVTVSKGKNVAEEVEHLLSVDKTFIPICLSFQWSTLFGEITQNKKMDKCQAFYLYIPSPNKSCQ